MRLRFIANGNVRDDLPDDVVEMLVSAGIAERLYDEDEPAVEPEEPAPMNGRRRYRRRDLQPEP